MGLTRARPEMRDDAVDVTTQIVDPVNNTAANTGTLRALLGRALRQLKKTHGEDNWYTPPTWSLKQSYNPGNHENIYSFKQVRTATTANITLSGSQTVGGVAITDNMRVLVKNQTATAENGIYAASTTGAWTRVDDLNAASEFVSGLVIVNQQDGKAYRLSTVGAIVVGTTGLTFTEFPPVSTTTVQGISELADATEAKALTDTTKPMAPARVLDAMHTRSLKADVRATTAGSNIALDNTTTTLDGVTLANGDRVLVRHQTTQSQNGIYVVSTSGAWTRAVDLDDAADFLNGVTVRVREGTATNAGQFFYLSSTTVVTVGTTAITFAIQPGAPAAAADASSTQKGVSQTSVNPVTATIPIVLGINDPVFDTFIDGCALTWDSATVVAMEPGALWIPAANKVVNIPTRITLTLPALTANTKYYVYAVYNTGTGAVTLEAVTTTPVVYSGYARRGSDTARRYIGMVLGNAAGTGAYAFFMHSNGWVFYLEPTSAAPFEFISDDRNAANNSTAESGTPAAVVPITSRMVETDWYSWKYHEIGVSSSNDNFALNRTLWYASVTGLWQTLIFMEDAGGNGRSATLHVNSSQQFEYVANPGGAQPAVNDGLFVSCRGYLEVR